MDNNLYQILEISKSANQDEIKKAYRKLVMIYHPDKEYGNHSKFIEIQNAYEILGNELKREEYDKIFEIYSKKNNSASYTQTNRTQSAVYKEKNKSKWEQYFIQYRNIGLPAYETEMIEYVLKKLQEKYFASPIDIEIAAHNCKFFLDQIKTNNTVYTNYVNFIVHVLYDSIIKTYNGRIIDFNSLSHEKKKDFYLINKILIRIISFIINEFDISPDLKIQLIELRENFIKIKSKSKKSKLKIIIIIIAIILFFTILILLR